jgi:hypothetical protein
MWHVKIQICIENNQNNLRRLVGNYAVWLEIYAVWLGIYAVSVSQFFGGGFQGGHMSYAFFMR